MGTLRIENVTNDIPELTLEEIRNDNQFAYNEIKNAYFESIAKRISFKKIIYDDTIVGYYIVKLSRFSIEQEIYDDYDNYSYHALHLKLIYIFKNYRKSNFGSLAVASFIQSAHIFSEDSGCRFITLESLKNLENWYSRLGFVNTKIDTNAGYTTKMFLDMRDSNLYESYINNL